MASSLWNLELEADGLETLAVDDLFGGTVGFDPQELLFGENFDHQNYQYDEQPGEAAGAPAAEETIEAGPSNSNAVVVINNDQPNPIAEEAAGGAPSQAVMPGKKALTPTALTAPAVGKKTVAAKKPATARGPGRRKKKKPPKMYELDEAAFADDEKMQKKIRQAKNAKRQRDLSQTRLDDRDGAIGRLTRTNAQLCDTNAHLVDRNKQLEAENQRLRAKLAEHGIQ